MAIERDLENFRLRPNQPDFAIVSFFDVRIIGRGRHCFRLPGTMCKTSRSIVIGKRPPGNPGENGSGRKDRHVFSRAGMQAPTAGLRLRIWRRAQRCREIIFRRTPTAAMTLSGPWGSMQVRGQRPIGRVPAAVPGGVGPAGASLPA